MVLQSLLELEEKLYLPSPLFFPDPDERQEVSIRNKWQIRLYLSFFLIFLIMHGFTNMELEAKLFTIIYLFLHGGSCLLFCRTRIWIYHWIYTVTAAVFELIMVIYMKSLIIYSVMVCFIAPLFVLTMTHSFGCVTFVFLCQAFIMQLKYKSVLTEIFQEMSVVEFSSKFINAATLIMIFITILYTILFMTHRNTCEQLRVSKVQAEEACSQLEIFIQTFSHELRNPLNSLLGNIHLTLQENLSPKVFEMVESAKICGDLLLQLINNILDTGKISMKKLEISPASSSLTEVIGVVWRISRDLIRKKNLNGFLKIDRNLPPILCLDYYRINQILLNLIGNAIKFTDKGSVSISLEWLPNRRVDNECFCPEPYDDTNDEGVFERTQNFKAISPNVGGHDYFIYVNSSKRVDLSTLNLHCNQPNIPGVLKVIIKDTGCGIKKEDLKSVFNKFTQFHKEQAQRKVGTGLGLYIAKEICEKMEGQIRLYSRYGVGTTFIVCIPTYCPKECQQTDTVDQIVANLKQQDINALLIDDNIFNIELLGNYITKIYGKVIEKAQNGSDGLMKYIQYRELRARINVVFLDIDMPLLDGRMVCQKIREYEDSNNLPQIKIIFVSGNYDESEIQDLLDKSGRYKADGFLKKPVSFETFVRILNDAIILDF